MRNLRVIALVLGFVLFAAYRIKTDRQAEQPIVDNHPVQPIPDEPYQPEPEPPREYTLEEAVASINEEDLKKDLYYLASQELEGRMSGKKGNIVAADYIKKKYESFGLDTMYDKFSIRRMNPGPNNETGDDFTQNIYAWIEGSDPVLKNEIVVVGAHMDHIGYGPSMSRSGGGKVHPGADDNASGTVALMQIAKAFSMLKGKVKRTVVFQSYSAEEMGLIGARHYCDNPSFPKDNPSIRSHVAMINMDMVGYLGKGMYFAGFHEGNSSVDLRAYINELNGKYSFARQITSQGSGGSDHACFYNKRVPVAFMHTGGHPHYHTPTDTPDRINYEGIEKVAKYTFELAHKVANAPVRVSFNYGGWQPMDYTHDHGHPEIPFPHPYHRPHDHDHGHSHEDE
jgi:hypothetical protein